MTVNKSHLQLVPPEGHGQPVRDGASKLSIYASRLGGAIGGALNRLSVPGLLRPMLYDDPVTGDRVQVSIGSRFTVLTVNGRDFYFRRLSGEFDGTGMVP